MKITDLTPDDKNFNQGTAKGREIISKSLSELGAGRSILIDKDNRIIAGNKTVEGARDVGIEDVHVVETTGDVLVAVKRVDIDLDSKKGRELALADNVAAKENILFSHDTLRPEAMKYGFDTSEWGYNSDTYTPHYEPTAMGGEVTPDDVEAADRKLQARFEPKEDEEGLTVTCPKCGHTFKVKA